jgi:hypothetical protein
MLEVCDLQVLYNLRYTSELLVAGTLEALSAMALKHLERGVASPFLVSNRLWFWHLGADAGLFP